MSSDVVSNVPMGTEAPSGEMPIEPVRTYTTPAQVLHWLTASLVLCMIAAGIFAKQLGGTPSGDLLLRAHKVVGILTLATVLVRVCYHAATARLGERQQPRPVLHHLLYVVLLIVPLIGWAGVSDLDDRTLFFGFSLPAIWREGMGYGEVLLSLHAYLAFALLMLVALHIGAAIQNHVFANNQSSGSTLEPTA